MRSGFFNNTEVWAEDFARYAFGMMSNGVLLDDANALKVSAGGGMSVNVAPGYAWAEGHFGKVESAETIPVTNADGTYTRIDRVCARLDMSLKTFSLVVLTGEISGDPQPPDIIRDGTIYDLGLALITIPAGSLEITDAMITDTRANTAVCGGAFPRFSSEVVWPAANSVGDIKMTACSAAPAKWILCDGREVSRTRYADLFANIGTAYGSGDGSSTFNVPDFRGRTAFGKDTGTFAALGTTGGEEQHTLTTDEMPAHSHTITVTTNPAEIEVTNAATSPSAASINDMGTGAPTMFTVSATAASTGGGQAHNNLPPYNTVNYIIYAGVE